MERIEHESERMDTLIEALLTLARLQGRPESIEREPVDISELLAMIVEDAQFEAGIKGCRVHCNRVRHLSRVSAASCSTAASRMIRNAVRYTRADTMVWVSAHISTDGNRLTVRITDHGRASTMTVCTAFRAVRAGDACVGFRPGPGYRRTGRRCTAAPSRPATKRAAG
jgi:signal transduction histidine kinase